MSLPVPRSIAAQLRFSALMGWLISTAVSAAGLPDTGQTTCYDRTVATSCANEEFPRQDASVGSGAPSYDKIDAGGNVLPGAASEWACTRDNATGLVWEVKTASGLRAQSHRYAWSNGDSTRNGGDAGGTTETTFCDDSLNGQACTSENYQAAVNALNLCGAGDWRLPTQRELLTLINAAALKPAVDVAYFPNTASDTYWAANTYTRIPAFAWGVHFSNGAASADYKNRPYRVRLVRGTPF